MNIIFYSKISRCFLSNFIKQKCNYSKLAKDSDLNFLSSLLLSNINQVYSNMENYKFVPIQDYKNIYKEIINFLDSANIKDNQNFDELIKKQQINYSGIFISKEYNGLGKNYSSCAYLMEKLPSATMLSYDIIINQLLCAEVISKYGTEAQKRKYLPKIVQGHSVGGFCLNESSSGSHIQMMEGVAEYCHETKRLKVTSTKNWIYNAKNMDFCVLFVKVKSKKPGNNLSAFLIDKPLEGPNVHLSVQYNIFNVPNVFQVAFNDSLLSAELVGNIGDGFKIANEVQNCARFAVASSLLGIAKEAVHEISLQSQLSSSTYVNDKIVDWASKIFELDTSIYFTTNIMNSQLSTENFAIQNAVLKIHASEIALEVVSDCIDIAQESNKNVEFFLSLRNKIRALDSFLGSADLLRLFVGGVSLQKIIPEISDDIYKLNHVADNNHLWKLNFCRMSVHPRSLKHLEIDKNFDSIKHLLTFLQKELIMGLSESGFNTPNEDFAIWRIASCLVTAYHLLTVCGRYKMMSKDRLSPNAIIIVQRSMDRLRNKLITLLGETVAERISVNVNNTKYRVMSKIIFKNEVHGIDSAISRNW